MEDRIKQIIAPFLNIEPVNIASSTFLDRNALKSSIYVHRMYARLASEGFVIQDYSNVKTFADLMSMLSTSTEKVPVTEESTLNESAGSGIGIGIDIEAIAAMPITNDFRDHSFYKANFSASEISYCILQNNPYASFAGLFAAKEAILKADNLLRRYSFNTLIIDHDENGKPFFSNGIELSISHTEDIAAAVAVKRPFDSIINQGGNNTVAKPSSTSGITGWLALLIAIIALILSIVH